MERSTSRYSALSSHLGCVAVVPRVTREEKEGLWGRLRLTGHCGQFMGAVVSVSTGSTIQCHTMMPRNQHTDYEVLQVDSLSFHSSRSTPSWLVVVCIR